MQRTADGGHTGSAEDVRELGDLQSAYVGLLLGVGTNGLLAAFGPSQDALSLALDALCKARACSLRVRTPAAGPSACRQPRVCSPLGQPRHARPPSCLPNP